MGAENQIPHNLPVQATPFIGRLTELEALAKLMADPAIRLVTIVGPGGMGKTRLGLAVAEQWITPRRDAPTDEQWINPRRDAPTDEQWIAPRRDAPTARLYNDFPNGVFFINLAPLSEVSHIVPAVADALNFPLQGGGSFAPTTTPRLFTPKEDVAFV